MGGNDPMGPGGPGSMPGGPGGIPGGPGGMPSGPGGMPGGPGGPSPNSGPGGPSPGGFNKNSPIMGAGPTTTDSNYAQQFHDFQQQLYATNTRSSQMRGSAGPGGGPMGPGPGGPMSMGPGMPPVSSQGNFYAGPPGSGPMPSSAK